MLQVEFKRANSTIKLPVQSTPGAVGYDFYSNETVQIGPGARALVGTGIFMSMPDHLWMKLESRSGLAAKGIVATGGVIDPDYRGEVKVILNNLTTEPYQVTRGDRIAQGIFMPRIKICVQESDILTDSVRGADGFGSTGN